MVCNQPVSWSISDWQYGSSLQDRNLACSSIKNTVVQNNLSLLCWHLLYHFEQNWFTNRRASDWRRGILCRRCRYFKSPLASEELHQLYPCTRHCVIMLSIPQYFSQLNLVNNAGLTLTSDSTPSRPPTAEVDYNGNDNSQIGSKHFVRDYFPLQLNEHQLQTPIRHPQYSDSEIAESRQQQQSQLKTISHSAEVFSRVLYIMRALFLIQVIDYILYWCCEISETEFTPDGRIHGFKQFPWSCCKRDWILS